MRRREFLATSTVVLGANDRNRIGIIGAGGRGQHLTGFLRQVAGVEIAAVCDVFETNARAARQQTGGTPEIFADHRQLLARKDIDAVVIAPPDHWHTPILIDVAHWFTGDDKPLHAVASGGVFWLRDGRDVPDTLSVIYEYGKGHAVTATATLASRNTSRTEFFGTGGTLLMRHRIYSFTPIDSKAAVEEAPVVPQPSERRQCIGIRSGIFDITTTRILRRAGSRRHSQGRGPGEMVPVREAQIQRRSDRPRNLAGHHRQEQHEPVLHVPELHYGQS